MQNGTRNIWGYIKMVVNILTRSIEMSMPQCEDMERNKHSNARVYGDDDEIRKKRMDDHLKTHTAAFQSTGGTRSERNELREQRKFQKYIRKLEYENESKLAADSMKPADDGFSRAKF